MKESKLRTFSIAIASLIMSSVAYAAMDIDSRVSQLEHQMSQVHTETALGTYGANMASTKPNINGVNLFISVEPLYLSGRAGGLEYAYVRKGDLVPEEFPLKAEKKNTKIGWRWGGRIGLGYIFGHNGWDLGAQCTYVHFRGDDSSFAESQGLVIPNRGTAHITSLTVAGTPTFGYCKEAQAQYKLHFCSAALELGKGYFVDYDTSLRPYIGVQTTCMNQKYHVSYTGGKAYTPPVPPNFDEPNAEPAEYGLGNSHVNIDDRCHFKGAGPCLGLGTKWYLRNGFSLIGNLRGIFLFGRFQVEHQENWTEHNNTTIDITANKYDFSPALQATLGIQYETFSEDRKQHVSVSLNFETHHYFRQNQMIKVCDDYTLRPERYSEDIGIHGVTGKFTWSF